jgi:hypothetical protein
MVRTEASQALNPGSTPGRVTKFINSLSFLYQNFISTAYDYWVSIIIYTMWYYYEQGIKYVRNRLEYVSEVNKDIAQVLFAAFAIESFTKSPVNWSLVSIGLLLSVVFWIFGITSFRRK